jgi:16S rRNA (uracil1498-N3)-methyltransferase
VQRVVVDPAQIQANQLTLTAEQRHYLQRVLRLQSGDRFLALDGQGHLWAAVLQRDATQATLTAHRPGGGHNGRAAIANHPRRLLTQTGL